MNKIIIASLVALTCVTAAIAYTPPKSLSEPLDDNYTNNCDDPGYESVTDSAGNTSCVNTSNGQPQS